MLNLRGMAEADTARGKWRVGYSREEMATYYPRSKSIPLRSDEAKVRQRWQLPIHEMVEGGYEERLDMVMYCAWKTPNELERL